ncbi:MAG TPA: hypothetical protein VIV07_05375 [Sphingomicrobium sp.]
MKAAIGIALTFWLMAGVIGAGMMGVCDLNHWKKIARGPITLGQALNDDPVSYPGSN